MQQRLYRHSIIMSNKRKREADEDLDVVHRAKRLFAEHSRLQPSSIDPNAVKPSISSIFKAYQALAHPSNEHAAITKAATALADALQGVCTNHNLSTPQPHTPKVPTSLGGCSPPQSCHAAHCAPPRCMPSPSPRSPPWQPAYPATLPSRPTSTTWPLGPSSPSQPPLQPRSPHPSYRPVRHH